MITTTLGALVNAVPILKRLNDVRVSSAQTRYDLRKLCQLTDAEVQRFEQDRVAIVEEFGRPSGNGHKEVLPTSPDWPMFVAKVNECAAVAVTLECSPPRMTLPSDFALSVNEENALDSLVLIAEDSDGR